MKLENQVCSLEQAKKLKELGINQESEFLYFTGHYVGNTTSYDLGWRGEFLSRDGETPLDQPHIAAFTVAELGVMLGNKALKIHPMEDCTNEAIERADDLICLLEHEELFYYSCNDSLLNS